MLDIEIVKIEKILDVYWIMFKEKNKPMLFNAAYLNASLRKKITHESMEVCHLCYKRNKGVFNTKCQYLSEKHHHELEKKLQESLRKHKDRLKLLGDGFLL